MRGESFELEFRQRRISRTIVVCYKHVVLHYQNLAVCHVLQDRGNWVRGTGCEVSMPLLILIAVAFPNL
jgi:hypothetical protein